MGKYNRKENRSLAQLSAIAAAILSLGVSSLSQAALVQVSGNTVNFIYDDAQVGVGLFGAPSVVGDSLVFSPTTFNAESVNGVGVHTGTVTDSQSASFSFRVVAKSATTVLDGASATEAGAYSMTGVGTLVDVDSTMKVSDFNDPVFGPFDTGLLAPSDLSLVTGASEAWNSSGGVDLSTVMWDGVNDIEVVLTNVLTAQTMLGEAGSAYIDKSNITIDIATTVVPVPAAVWLFGSGLLGLAGIAARKNKA